MIKIRIIWNWCYIITYSKSSDQVSDIITLIPLLTLLCSPIDTRYITCISIIIAWSIWKLFKILTQNLFKVFINIITLKYSKLSTKLLQYHFVLCKSSSLISNQVTESS